MQRRQGPQRTDPRLDVGIDPHGASVPRSPMHDAVANRIGCRQAVQRDAHGRLVDTAIGQVQIVARENRTLFIEQAQLQRTRACVHDQDAQAINDTSAGRDSALDGPKAGLPACPRRLRAVVLCGFTPGALRRFRDEAGRAPA